MSQSEGGGGVPMHMSIDPTPPHIPWLGGLLHPPPKEAERGSYKKKLQQGTLAFNCPTNPFTELTTVLLRGERKGVEYVSRKAAQQTGGSLNGRKVLRLVALSSSACCLLLFCGTGTHKVRFSALWASAHLLAAAHRLDNTFHFQVTSHPEKVKVYGPGISEGRIGEKGVFTIETAEAGSGQMSVRVRGPKKSFDVRTQPHPTINDALLVEYNPTQTGTYAIDVEWTGVHVSGSPFTVNVVEGTEVFWCTWGCWGCVALLGLGEILTCNRMSCDPSMRIRYDIWLNLMIKYFFWKMILTCHLNAAAVWYLV